MTPTPAPLSTLSELVGTPDAFATAHRSRRPAVFRPDNPRSPLRLADVDEVLTVGSLQSAYVELARTDKVIPADAYCTPRTVNQAVHQGFPDGAKIRRLMDEGSTLLLRCVEQWHAPTARLTSAIGRELGRRVEAFFFVTPPGRQGLRVHRDDADVLVLQINGSKEWHVHEGPADGHWAPGPVQDPGPELLSLTLHAGEVLYVPRGFAHYATGDSGLSTHLSLTLREIGGAHLYKALQRLLLDGFTLMPRPLDDADLAAETARVIGHLTTRLGQIGVDEVIAQARAELLAQTPRPVGPGLAALAASMEPDPARSLKVS